MTRRELILTIMPEIEKLALDITQGIDTCAAAIADAILAKADKVPTKSGACRVEYLYRSPCCAPDGVVALGEHSGPARVLVFPVEVLTSTERDARACYWLGRLTRLIDEANKEIIP